MLYDPETCLPGVTGRVSLSTIPKTRGTCPSYGKQMRMKPPPSDTFPERSTQYRLPRLKDDNDKHQQHEEDYKVCSRHGYDYYNTKSGVEAHMRAALSITPRVPHSPHRHNTVNPTYPKFQEAMISPVPRASARLYAGNVIDPAFYRGQSRMAFSEDSGHLHAFDPSPTPVMNHHPRGASLPKSAKSIHWTLSPFKNLQYDRKGRSRVQGPYSREFTVTCTAPQNWLKMRLGRANSTLT